MTWVAPARGGENSARAARPVGLPVGVLLTTDPDEFFAAEWGLCVEAGGQPTVVEHAGRCISMGRDFMATSIGALAAGGTHCPPPPPPAPLGHSDRSWMCGLDAFYEELLAQGAAAGGGRLLLASGAMPAVDWMHSAAVSLSLAGMARRRHS